MTKRKDKYRTVEQAFNDLRKRMKSVARPEETIPEDFILVDGESFLDDMNLLHSLTFDELIELCTTIDTNKHHEGIDNSKKLRFTRNKLRHLLHLYLRILYLNEEYEGDVLDRVFECENYHKKSENIEYMSMIYGREYALKKLKEKSERVAGDKNPGYQHGGKLSAFSKNFKNYEGMTDEEIEAGQKAVAQASSKTKQANPQNENTSIEYYTSRGMSEEEAIIARSERQSTFSLEKCVEKHGMELGYDVWYARQQLWQESLNNRPYEDIFQSRRVQQRTLWNRLTVNNEYSYVYLFHNESAGIYKFGITSDINKRLGFMRYEFGEGFSLVATMRFPSSIVIDVEDRLCEEFRYLNLMVFNREDKGKTYGEMGFTSLEYVPETENTKNLINEWYSVVSEFMN